MTSREFCYWLQGFFEISGCGLKPTDNVDVGLIGEKVKMIRRHLDLVFAHEIDPSYPDGPKLDKIHTPRLDDFSNIKVKC